MLFSWTLIQFDGGKLAGIGEAPAGKADRSIPIYIGALIAVPVLYFLFTNLMNAEPPVPGSGIVGYILSLSLMGKLLFGTFLVSVPGILIWSYAKGSRQEAQMMSAAMVLIVFNVVFWTLFEQAGSSLTLFADRNTDLTVFGLFSISAGQTQFFNAFFIVALAPVMSILWTRLAAAGREPSIPVKFGIALIGVGLGFLFLVWGASMVGPSFKVAIWWLAGLYLIHSFAELCISPVGPQHDHQAVDRADRRADDGRLVPVDLGRAICRGRGRAGRERRDGRRAGHQSEGQPRHLCGRVLDDRPGVGGDRAVAARAVATDPQMDAWSDLMTTVAPVALASAAFVGSHFALSHPLRAPLVGGSAKRGFAGLYSLVAFATLGWVIVAYRAAPARDRLLAGRRWDLGGRHRRSCWSPASC